RNLKVDAEPAEFEEVRRHQLQLVRRRGQHQRPAHAGTSSEGTAPSGATSAITSREGWRIRCAASSTSWAVTAAIRSAYFDDASAPRPSHSSKAKTGARAQLPCSEVA